MKKMNQQGFTLIELMIVIAIIGILASIALPAYQTYMKKAKFSEVVLAVSDAKTAVELCYQDIRDLDECNHETNGILEVATSDADIALGARVATVTVDKGEITATAVTENGLNGEVYILTATKTEDEDRIIWTVNSEDNDKNCKKLALC